MWTVSAWYRECGFCENGSEHLSLMRNLGVVSRDFINRSSKIPTHSPFPPSLNTETGKSLTGKKTILSYNSI